MHARAHTHTHTHTHTYTHIYTLGGQTENYILIMNKCIAFIKYRLLTVGVVIGEAILEELKAGKMFKIQISSLHWRDSRQKVFQFRDQCPPTCDVRAVILIHILGYNLSKFHRTIFNLLECIYYI